MGVGVTQSPKASYFRAQGLGHRKFIPGPLEFGSRIVLLILFFDGGGWGGELGFRILGVILPPQMRWKEKEIRMISMT